MGIIIAAGALFTAVYDVIYKYNSSNTINLNAATVDMMGRTIWYVDGDRKNDYKGFVLKFDTGTYMMIFSGQSGMENYIEGSGAACLAFYKGNSMTVTIGVGGGRGSNTDGSLDGGGCTTVQTNFALPVGYAGSYAAIASGSGLRNNPAASYIGGEAAVKKVIDGTFAGWPGDDKNEVIAKMGLPTGFSYGTPASQFADGFANGGVRRRHA